MCKSESFPPDYLKMTPFTHINHFSGVIVKATCQMISSRHLHILSFMNRTLLAALVHCSHCPKLIIWHIIFVMCEDLLLLFTHLSSGVIVCPEGEEVRRYHIFSRAKHHKPSSAIEINWCLALGFKTKIYGKWHWSLSSAKTRLLLELPEVRLTFLIAFFRGPDCISVSLRVSSWHNPNSTS